MLRIGSWTWFRLLVCLLFATLPGLLFAWNAVRSDGWRDVEGQNAIYARSGLETNQHLGTFFRKKVWIHARIDCHSRNLEPVFWFDKDLLSYRGFKAWEELEERLKKGEKGPDATTLVTLSGRPFIGQFYINRKRNQATIRHLRPMRSDDGKVWSFEAIFALHEGSIGFKSDFLTEKYGNSWPGTTYFVQDARWPSAPGTFMNRCKR